MKQQGGRTLTENVSRLIRSGGLTDAQLAGRLTDRGLHASANTVIRWRTGERTPRPWYLPGLADIYGVTVDDIFAGKEALSCR